MKTIDHAVRRALAVALLLTPALVAQRGAGRFRSLRDDPAVVAAFAEVVARADAFVAVVRRGDEPVALGTLVDPKGLVVTKASEVGDATALRCVFGDRALVAHRVGVDELCDLLLLRVDGLELEREPTWADVPPKPGAWLVSVDGDGTPAGIGVLSAAPYRHSINRGYLGVQLDTAAPTVRLRSVLDDTAAQRAGLASGDEILALDGAEVATSDAFIRAIRDHAPGETIALRIRRDGSELDVQATLLRDRSGQRSDQEALWGPLSAVRAGFDVVLQHDTVLEPAECGGPLVDLDGRIVGVNIARAGRVETLALPADEVRAAVARLLAAERPGRR